MTDVSCGNALNWNPVKPMQLVSCCCDRLGLGGMAEAVPFHET